MKKFSGLAIILAALILGAYYGMGVLTEKTIRKNINVLDQSNGLYAEIEQYDKGLFHSEAKIKWRLHMPERVSKNANGQPQILPAQDYTMSMPLIIHHGPFIFTPHGLRFGLGYTDVALPFPAEYNQQFETQFSKESVKPQLDLSIFVNYLNESTINFKIPNFNLIAKEGKSHFEWLGMNATTVLSSEMTKVEGKVDLDGLTATTDDTKMVLGKISSDYNLHETSAGLYLGHAHFILPSFAVFVKEQKMFELIDLSVKSDSDIEEHLFNTHLIFTVKSLLINEQNYGPGTLEFALRNLDADVLAKINQQTAAMQNGTDIQRQQATLALFPEIPKLFNKGAAFEISKLSFKIPQGQIEGSLHITMAQGETSNPFELIQKIQGKAKLQVPEAAVKHFMQQSVIQQIAKQPDLQQTLLQQLQVNKAIDQSKTPALSMEQIASMQAEKQIAALQQTGLVTVQGTDYIIEVSLSQGKFTVNGKPFDSSMVKF